MSISFQWQLVVVAGRQYNVQVVVREEDEATPGADPRPGDLLFFPLPDAAFVAVQDGNDVNYSHVEAERRWFRTQRERKRYFL